jgi:hypothetical protein
MNKCIRKNLQKKKKGPTRDRTGIAGIRNQSDDHYTIEPNLLHHDLKVAMMRPKQVLQLFTNHGNKVLLTVFTNSH